MTSSAIQITHPTRDLKAIRAADNLSLEVAPGTAFGFPGANGAGKTTTIRLLLGLLEPTSSASRTQPTRPRAIPPSTCRNWRPRGTYIKEETKRGKIPLTFCLATKDSRVASKAYRKQLEQFVGPKKEQSHAHC